MSRHTFSIETVSLWLLTQLNGPSTFMLGIIAKKLRENPNAWLAIRFEFKPLDNKSTSRREIHIQGKSMDKSNNETIAIGHTGASLYLPKHESMYNIIGYITAAMYSAFALDPKYGEICFSTSYSDEPGCENSVVNKHYEHNEKKERQMTFFIDFRYIPSHSPENDTYKDLYIWD